MYCRLIEATAPENNREAGLANIQANVVPRLKSMPGFRGAYWLGDRATGKVYAATFFDSKESMDSTREQAQAIREQGMAEGGVSFDGVKEMEVIANTGEKVSSSATHARVNLSKIDPSRLDDGISGIKSVLIPGLKDQPGFQGAFWLGDRQSGEGFSATLWDSAETAGQSEQLAGELREKMTGTTGVEVNPLGTFEIVAKAETPT